MWSIRKSQSIPQAEGDEGLEAVGPGAPDVPDVEEKVSLIEYEVDQVPDPIVEVGRPETDPAVPERLLSADLPAAALLRSRSGSRERRVTDRTCQTAKAPLKAVPMLPRSFVPVSGWT